MGKNVNIPPHMQLIRAVGKTSICKIFRPKNIPYFYVYSRTFAVRWWTSPPLFKHQEMRTVLSLVLKGGDMIVPIFRDRSDKQIFTHST